MIIIAAKMFAWEKVQMFRILSLKHRHVPTLAFLAKYRKEKKSLWFDLTYTESPVQDNGSNQITSELIQ